MTDDEGVSRKSRPIPVKEGILLDRDGTPLAGPSDDIHGAGGRGGPWDFGPAGGSAHVRVWRPGPIMLLFFAAVGAVLFFAGIAVAAVIVLAMLIAAIIRVVLRALGLIR